MKTETEEVEVEVENTFRFILPLTSEVFLSPALSPPLSVWIKTC